MTPEEIGLQAIAKKTGSEGAEVTYGGTAFHIRGLATGNVRSTTVERRVCIGVIRIKNSGRGNKWTSETFLVLFIIYFNIFNVLFIYMVLKSMDYVF